jgi:hypothetical protein
LAVVAISLGYKNRNPIELDGRFTPCGVSIGRNQLMKHAVMKLGQ